MSGEWTLGKTVTLVLSLCAWACGGTKHSFSSQSRTLRMAVEGRMEGYALARTRNFYEANFSTLVFEGLTKIDDQGRVEPSLARRWEVSPDGRVYRFTLRSGVRFHDGSGFGAADVPRAWEQALREPRVGDRHAWMLDNIVGADAIAPGSLAPLTGVRAVDDTTLEVRLVHRLTRFPAQLGETQAFIGAASSDDAHPVGTGPWRWVRGAATADEILLVRNPGYWGRPPKLDSLVVVVLPDSDLVDAFASGAVDCTVDMTRASRIALAARPDIRLNASGAPGMVRIVFNLRMPVLRELRVRRALVLALDRQRLAQEAAAGAVIHANGPLPRGTLGFDSLHVGARYDPAEASRLLLEARFPFDQPLRIVMPSVATPEFSADFSNLLQTYWRAVGVRVLPWDSTSTSQPDLDLRISYPESADPDAYLYSRFHSRVAGMAGNKGGFADAIVDQLLDRGRQESDPAVRARLMREASDRIDDLVANIFLWFAPVLTASSTRLNGCVGGGPTSKYLDVDLAGAGHTP